MYRLQLLVFVVLLIVSPALQERVCKYKLSETFCLKHCCGKPDDTLLCRDSCDGIPCSQREDCGDGCCKSGKCTKSGCNSTAWYVIAIPVIVIVLAVLIAACRIWWFKTHRVIHAGVIVSVVGRDGQLYAHDDSMRLLTGDDCDEDQDQRNEQRSGQTSSEEILELPPPYAP